MNIIHNFLIQVHKQFFYLLRTLSQSRYWILYTTLLTTILSLFLAFPRKEIILNDYSSVPEVQAVKKQIKNPFQKLSYPPGSHNAKLSFRLTVPIFAHFLNIDFETCKLIEIICGILLFTLTILISYRITSDKEISILMCFIVGCIFPGSTSFTEFRGTFDGLAIFFLTLALFSTRPIFTGFTVFLASWIDERALIASSLVALYHLLPNSKDQLCLFKTIFRNLVAPSFCACVLAWLLYITGRYLLTVYLGFTTDTKGVFLFMNHINNLPIGIWTALEGAWILVVLSIISLILRKEISFLLIYLLLICIITFVAFSVIDITRSIAYLFPTIFIALRLITRTEKPSILKKYIFIAFLISLLWPMYYVGGKENIWWYAPPLPIQLVRSFIK